MTHFSLGQMLVNSFSLKNIPFTDERAFSFPSQDLFFGVKRVESESVSTLTQQESAKESREKNTKQSWPTALLIKDGAPETG